MPYLKDHGSEFGNIDIRLINHSHLLEYQARFKLFKNVKNLLQKACCYEGLVFKKKQNTNYYYKLNVFGLFSDQSKKFGQFLLCVFL